MAEKKGGKRRGRSTKKVVAVEGCLFERPSDRDSGIKREIRNGNEGPREPSSRGVDAFRNL